ncbi:hypothetical protein OQA88_7020 [Cercophora sp. LCS_1]
MDRQFRFVTVSDPTQAPSSESRKLAYSHAFRQAHARRRRERIEQYRKETANEPVGKTVTAPDEAVPSPLCRALDSNKDPFSSLARPLSSEECVGDLEDAPDLQASLKLLADDLVADVHVIIPFTIGHCGLLDRPGGQKMQMLREWVGLAITDDVLMVAAILLSTCRYIMKVQPGNLAIAQLALQYKQICIQTLLRETGNPFVNVATVAKALALALDEVTAGEHTVARKHVEGVAAMVNSSGGVEELGMTGLLEQMYRKLMEIFVLEGPERSSPCTKTSSQGACAVTIAQGLLNSSIAHWKGQGIGHWKSMPGALGTQAMVSRRALAGKSEPARRAGAFDAAAVARTSGASVRNPVAHICETP